MRFCLWCYRRRLELGTVVLTEPVSDNAGEQKCIIFDPIPRVDRNRSFG